jgi:hypothetical protein
MPYTKEQRKAVTAKYLSTHRDEWNEYLRNYARNKYQNDPVHREKEKARKNLANKKKRELKQQLLLAEAATNEEPTIELTI